MNKKNISRNALFMAIAIACGSSLSASANEVYGDIRLSVNNINAGTGSNVSEDNNASRIGLKGSYDMGNGFTALYHVQLGLNADTSTAGDVITRRFAFAGLKGGFGTALFGTLSSPYKMAGLKVDPFYDTVAGAGLAGATYGLSGFTNGFFDNVVAYITPTMNGFHANAVAVIDDTTADEHSYNWGVTYDNGSLNVSVQLLDVNSATPANEQKATRLAASYKSGSWKVGGSFEKVDTSTVDTDYMYLSSVFNMNKKTSIAASYGDVESNGSGYNLGVFHKLFKKTTLYALYSKVDYDASADRKTFSIGLSQKFSIGGK
jgi:predicted porin